MGELNSWMSRKLPGRLPSSDDEDMEGMKQEEVKVLAGGEDPVRPSVPSHQLIPCATTALQPDNRVASNAANAPREQRSATALQTTVSDYILFPIPEDPADNSLDVAKDGWHSGDGGSQTSESTLGMKEIRSESPKRDRDSVFATTNNILRHMPIPNASNTNPAFSCQHLHDGDPDIADPASGQATCGMHRCTDGQLDESRLPAATPNLPLRVLKQSDPISDDGALNPRTLLLIRNRKLKRLTISRTA
ncbi:hypothetical protein K458DRAFT_460481 [Lentithecium fluviatile CBS 122367]|uniref:Uncharacterized protein n=1 Tax=Lentithecium fluviatile CBS 122367 TaxID=1168545 RepID=A0A6G1INX1_9PLEO|nr:hypothetical protein K458DRAFT_460481 [Lentithecium fluviatile CBS 122367]